LADCKQFKADLLLGKITGHRRITDACRVVGDGIKTFGKTAGV